MAAWIEIHCDTPEDDRPDSVTRRTYPYGYLQCDRLSSDYPGVLLDSSMKASTMLKLASQHAIAAGYKKLRKHGWQCRFCLKYRTKFTEAD